MTDRQARRGAGRDDKAELALALQPCVCADCEAVCKGSAHDHEEVGFGIYITGQN
jgi:hypothetical protein